MVTDHRGIQKKYHAKTQRRKESAKENKK